MLILPKSDYYKVVAPLQQVTINHLFARAVVEQKVDGKIYVDDAEQPQTFYIVHPYGMSLLLGRSDNAAFNTAFKAYAVNAANTRNSNEWMQAFPDAWDAVLVELLRDVLVKSTEPDKNERGIVQLNTRVNFAFNKEKYLQLQPIAASVDIRIAKADGAMFRAMQGSVVPLYFWNSEEDFLQNGLAFGLFHKGELASMAFSSFWFGKEFELGIETVAAYRGKGLAELVCRAIIDYCISKDYEPIWSCRLENTRSYNLAQRLAFEPTLYLPYYRLSC